MYTSDWRVYVKDIMKPYNKLVRTIVYKQHLVYFHSSKSYLRLYLHTTIVCCITTIDRDNIIEIYAPI
jgi:hypothetical protein